MALNIPGYLSGDRTTSGWWSGVAPSSASLHRSLDPWSEMPFWSRAGDLDALFPIDCAVSDGASGDSRIRLDVIKDEISLLRILRVGSKNIVTAFLLSICKTLWEKEF